MHCDLFLSFIGGLFQGRSNNHMLKLFMELRGKIPSRLIRSGQLSEKHFDSSQDFIWIDQDSFTKQVIVSCHKLLICCRYAIVISFFLFFACSPFLMFFWIYCLLFFRLLLERN